MGLVLGPLRVGDVEGDLVALLDLHLISGVKCERIPVPNTVTLPGSRTIFSEPGRTATALSLPVRLSVPYL